MLDTHVIEHYPGWQGGSSQNLVNRLHGGRFVHTDASTVTLEVIGLDQWMYFSVSDGQDLTQIVRMFSDLSCNLVLFAGPSGTVVDGALVAALTGGGAYSWWSDPIGMMVNDGAGNIISFEQTGNFFKFHAHADGEAVLVFGTVIVGPALVDLSAFVPTESIQFRLSVFADNIGAVACYCDILTTNGVDMHVAYSSPWSINAVGYSQYSRALIDVDIINPADDLLYYLWSGAVVSGLSLFIQGVKLY